MNHHIVIDWGPTELSCSCGWEPTYDFKTYDGADWQERQYDEHLREQIRALPEPTLGLKGGVSREAVLDLLR